MTKKIKWLIAHEPQHLFLRTAKAFAETLEANTDGAFQIEIITDKEYSQLNPDFKVTSNIINEVAEGRIEMSQTQTHRFGDYDVNYRVFDMPFLFRDHDHATRVFEGSIGTAMGKRLKSKAGVRGLAFTYSGGYRVFGSNEPIMNLSELAGRKIRVNSNPVNSDYVESLGGEPMVIDSYGYDEIEAGTLDAAETTYLRFRGKYLLKSQHNMFLTTIVVGNKFWEQLDPEMQSKFEHAAREAGRMEREWSRQDLEKFERDCAENGVTIYDDKQKMQDSVGKVYDKWTPLFNAGLIDHIKRH